MSIVIEESDETLFWLEIILQKELVNKSQVDGIWKEGNELTAIFVSSMKTIKDRVNALISKSKI